MKETSQVFLFSGNNELHIKENKTNIEWFLHIEQNNTERKTNSKYVTLEFSPEDSERFINEFQEMAHRVWKNLNIKEADSYGNDYWEYYDRKLDNNGYLTLNHQSDGTIQLKVGQVETGNPKVYQFNKAKAGTFIYDLLNPE